MKGLKNCICHITRTWTEQNYFLLKTKWRKLLLEALSPSQRSFSIFSTNQGPKQRLGQWGISNQCKKQNKTQHCRSAVSFIAMEKQLRFSRTPAANLINLTSHPSRGTVYCEEALSICFNCSWDWYVYEQPGAFSFNARVHQMFSGMRSLWHRPLAVSLYTSAWITNPLICTGLDTVGVVAQP